jgi:hypothetical protein
LRRTVRASKSLLSAWVMVAAGCVHGGPAPQGPEDVARSYARALEQGRVDDAWALSAPLDREQFAARYASEAARKSRADALREAANGKPSTAVALEVREKGWRVVEQTTPAAPLADDTQARTLVGHFLAAVDSGDFETVLGDLSASWRARYTPARLKADFSTEPAAASRLARIRTALAGRWEVTIAGPQLPLGEGKTLKLVREGEALKVAALE